MDLLESIKQLQAEHAEMETALRTIHAIALRWCCEDDTPAQYLMDAMDEVAVAAIAKAACRGGGTEWIR